MVITMFNFFNPRQRSQRTRTNSFSNEIMLRILVFFSSIYMVMSELIVINNPADRALYFKSNNSHYAFGPLGALDYLKNSLINECLTQGSYAFKAGIYNLVNLFQNTSNDRQLYVESGTPGNSSLEKCMLRVVNECYKATVWDHVFLVTWLLLLLIIIGSCITLTGFKIIDMYIMLSRLINNRVIRTEARRDAITIEEIEDENAPKTFDDRLKELDEDLQDEANEKAEELNYICPITQAIMDDPYTAEDGYCYEKTAIERWMNEQPGNLTSPSRRTPMGRTLIANWRLKNHISEFVEKYEAMNAERQITHQETEQNDAPQLEIMRHRRCASF